VLEISELTRRRDMIAQRRTPGRNRIGEYIAHRHRQAVGPPTLDGGRLPQGRKPGRIQRLAGIDIPDPGHNTLVQQSRFNRRALALQARRQNRAGKIFPVGSGPRCRISL
jgi:hypothetical protein